MRMMRISWLAFAVLVLIEAFVGAAGLSWTTVLADLVVANAVLVLAPCSYEDYGFSVRSALALVGLVLSTLLCASWCPDPDMKSALVTMVSLSGICVYLFWKTRSRFDTCHELFSMFSIWYSVEDYAHLLWTVALFVASMFLMAACMVEGWGGYVMAFFSTVFLLGIHFVSVLRAMKGRTMILDENKENEIISMVRSRAASADSEADVHDGRMNGLFMRVESYMNEKKPYLKDSFNLEMLSKEVYSNRLYLSKTIKQCSGKNFCQYVNGYRLDFVTNKLLESGGRISDVAMEAGFHSVSTFNMAFKTQYNLTPTEWVQMKKIEQRRKLRARPSSLTEQEQLHEPPSSSQGE